MTNPQLRTPFGHLELRPVGPSPGADGMQTYVLLPEIDELLGVQGFGLREPILVGGRNKRLLGLFGLRFH